MNEKVKRQAQNVLLFLLAILVMVLTYLYEFGGWPLVGLGLIAAVFLFPFVLGLAIKLHPGLARATAEQQRELDSRIICPQCQTKGSVTTEIVVMDRGVSGGKATAAVLTGGISVLATGLSKNEVMTKAMCSHCGSVWHF